VPLADRYGSIRRRKFRRLGDSCFSIYETTTEPLENEEPTAAGP
jgi:hypothetical protein